MPNVRVVARDQDAREVLTDTDRFSAKGNFNIESDDPPGGIPFITMIDAPEHTELRDRFMHWFAPRELRRHEARIRGIVSDVLDAVDFDEPIKFYRQIARQIPTRTVYAFLGLPEEDWDRLQDLDDAITEHVPKPLEALPEFFELAGYLGELVAARMAQEPTGADIIDGLVHAPEGYSQLEVPEMITHILSFIAAGTDSTAILMTNLLYELVREPKRWEALRASPKSIPAAIEESLRVDTPIQYVMRKAKQDTELGGCPVHAGEKLIVSLQSANWDEESWGADAGDFNLDRRPKQAHVGFGHGSHQCIGAPLARLEVRLLFEELLQRAPHLHLSPGFSWELEPNPIIRRPRELDLIAR
ncbi:cytochrome P450 [Rhodococcus ruber]|nr:cytochrome P450 [Rhodococcus ruber]